MALSWRGRGGAGARGAYDNEFRVPTDEDALTLPEIINGISDAVWTELDTSPNGTYTNRQPMVSSIRRNLQREHLERLIDLAMTNSGFGAASKPISNLSIYNLRELAARIDVVLEDDDRIDAYTVAHLSEASDRIEQVLSAGYIRNLDDIRIRLTLPPMRLGEQGEN